MKVMPVVVVGGLVLAGCVPGYFEEGDSTRVLLLTGINDGAVLQSDVAGAAGTSSDTVDVRVENHSKNPNIEQGRFTDDIVIVRYEVRYFRSDGLGTQGVDVPYTISGNLSFEVRAQEGVNVPIEVVRNQAKLEAPLSNLIGGGGARIVTMFAQITLWAQTTTGVATNSATGRLQIDFADFGTTS